MPGQPRWLQRHKIKRVKKRGKIARWVRCKTGRHNPPWDEATEEYGSIFIGGSCTRCPDETWHEVTYIGDVWDFPSGSSQEGNTTIVHKGPMLDAVDAHIKALLK